jgi:glycine cleavage system transcriptional repressor
MTFKVQPAMAVRHAILTIAGKDRPGILDEISQYLFERGGNIRDSRLVSLSGQFSMLFQITGTEAAIAKINEDLPLLAEQSRLQVQLNAIEPNAQQSAATFPYHFTASGKDQAGVVHRISHLMRVLNINIENVNVHVEHAEDPELARYRVDLDLAIPRNIPITMLRDYFNHLCGEMQMDWSLREV